MKAIKPVSYKVSSKVCPETEKRTAGRKIRCKCITNSVSISIVALHTVKKHHSHEFLGCRCIINRTIAYLHILQCVDGNVFLSSPPVGNNKMEHGMKSLHNTYIVLYIICGM